MSQKRSIVDAVRDNGQVTNGEKAGGDQQADEKALVFLRGVTVEILLAFLAARWLPSIWCSIVLVVVVIETARRNGFLRRERAGAWPAATALAVGLVFGFLGLALWSSARPWSPQVAFMQVTALWLAAVLVCWQTLRRSLTIPTATTGTSFLMFGSAILVLSYSLLGFGETWAGELVVDAPLDALDVVALRLFAGATALLGFSALLFGLSVLRGTSSSVVMPLALGGTATLVMVLAGSLGGDLGFLAYLLLAVGFITASGRADQDVHEFITSGKLLFGGVAVLFGVVDLVSIDLLAQVAHVLAWPAVVLAVAAVLKPRPVLSGAAFLMIGAALLLVGLSALSGGFILLGLGFVLPGCAAQLEGAGVLASGQTRARLASWGRWWITSRDAVE